MMRYCAVTDSVRVSERSGFSTRVSAPDALRSPPPAAAPCWTPCGGCPAAAPG
jgi:hypothetical protein